MTLDAQEFIRRFLQHVLPKGTHKVRYYGLWAPANRRVLHALQIRLATDQSTPLVKGPVVAGRDDPRPTAEPLQGPQCQQGVLVLIRRIVRQNRAPP